MESRSQAPVMSGCQLCYDMFTIFTDYCFHGVLNLNISFIYRDRIIHLLVLNAYKKPEIYVKLSKGMVWFVQNISENILHH